MDFRGLPGVAAGLVAWPCIAVAILLSPWFSWTDHALSDLGHVRHNAPAAFVFNGGLIGAGVLVGAFAALALHGRPRRPVALWTVPLFLTGIALSLVGLFSADAGEVHTVVSVAFFVLIPTTLLAFGAAVRGTGHALLGKLSAAAGLVAGLMWLVPWPWTGVAIQEAIAAGVATVWLCFIAVRGIPEAPGTTRTPRVQD